MERETLMKIITYRRVVVARAACPVCHEPAAPRPPRRWLTAHGPRPAWSHVDGEPLCPVVGAAGYRPARRPCLVTMLRPARPRRSRAVARRTVTRHRLMSATGAPAPGGAEVYLVAGGDMVAVFDSADAAGIMALTMTGANLEPVTLRTTEADWEQARAVLRSQQPHITVTDARSGRAAGAP
jgi:hypothetical protein